VRRLRAGVTGLGAMGRQHARVLAALPGVELVGGADPSPRARGAVPGLTVYPDLDSLLAAGLDMCVVAVPTLAHAEVGFRLAAAGVHALIEKPLAADAATGELLAITFEECGQVGCVGHVERYNSALRSMQRRLRRGDLGTVFQVATRRQGPFPQRIQDVGVVMDLATHDIDLTQWVTGSPYLRVGAFTGHPRGRPHEDLVAASGLLADGTVTSHLVNWLSPAKERLVTVTGEGGCLIADTLASQLWFQRNDTAAASRLAGRPDRGAAEGDLIRYSGHEPEALYTELANFRDAVLGQAADIVTLRQGMETVQVATAMLAAAGSGTAVAGADTPHWAAARLLPDGGRGAMRQVPA